MLHLIHLNLNSILLVRFVGGFSKYITLYNCFLLPFELMETYFAFCGIWGVFCFLFLSAFREGEGTKIFTMVHADGPRSPVALPVRRVCTLDNDLSPWIRKERASFSARDPGKLPSVKEVHWYRRGQKYPCHRGKEKTLQQSSASKRGRRKGGGEERKHTF